MMQNELAYAATPADNWLNILNKKYPNVWAELKKQRENIEYDAQKKDGWKCFRDLPEWAEMPTLLPIYTLNTTKSEALMRGARSAQTVEHEHPHYGPTMLQVHNMFVEEVMSLATMYLWKKTKGVYRFSEELYSELTKQPIDNDLHMETFFQLPEWAVYIETPGITFEGREMTGFIAHVDCALDYEDPGKRHTDLQFAIFLKGVNQPVMIALPFGSGTIKDAIRRMDQVDRESLTNRKLQDCYDANIYYAEPDYEERIKTFSPMLNLLMYLCSEEPDIQRTQQDTTAMPHRRQKQSAHKGHTEWDVGVRISYLLKKHKGGKQPTVVNEAGHSTSPRPHIRSAHWHSYWTGPRDAVYPKRKVIVKWLPPIPINMDWKSELPVNIRIVK